MAHNRKAFDDSRKLRAMAFESSQLKDQRDKVVYATKIALEYIKEGPALENIIEIPGLEKETVIKLLKEAILYGIADISVDVQ